MANLNKVLLIGNLTRSPETRYTPKGNACVQFGIAVNRKYKSGDELKEETTFLDVEAWGKTGETISKYVSKGDPIYIEGRLKLEQWENEGQKRSKLKVVVEEFQFLARAKPEA